MLSMQSSNVADERVRQGFVTSNQSRTRWKRSRKWKAGCGIKRAHHGFADLDKMTSGLQRQDLIIVRCPTFNGKTSLALMLAETAIHAGAVVVSSPSKCPRSYGDGAAGSQGNIDAQRFRNGFLIAA